MKFFQKSKVDNTQNSLKRTRHIWEAIDAVADEQGYNFLDATIEAKQEWLSKNFNEVIQVCIQKFGIEYENLRSFNAFIVSNEGHAVLYFEKKQK